MHFLVDTVHTYGFKFGIYTDRGTKTCGGRPGAAGYETIDAQSFADWGMDLLKEDSCDASQDHQTAFADYAKMRDALNATGANIFICN
jgi:alpha-galactosidase